MEEWLTECRKLYRMIQNDYLTVKIHQKKSATLATRIRSLYEEITMKDLSCFNLKNLQTIGSLSLLLVSLEEISEYFRVLQNKDKALEKRVKRFGSDEETFAKWNMTLQTCFDGLGIQPDHRLFDANKDEEDFLQDMEHLNQSLQLIFSTSGAETRVGHNGLAGEVKKMLFQQEGDRFQAKTLQAVKQEKEFDAKVIKFEEVIGKGGFGDVWRARYKGEYLAIKTVPSRALTAKAISSLKLEAEFMKKLSHPRIVACLGVVELGENYCMIMELCTKGSLATYISDMPAESISWEQRIDFSTDIATGMNYLHKLGVIHRDLKLGNVVLDQNDRAKITDFGLSVVKSESQTSMKLEECGTPQYMAPESFGLVPMFSTKSDVYAFAIILWELSHWKPAYFGISQLEIRDSIREGDRLPISSEVPKAVKKLITSCWSSNPKHRPDFKATLDLLASFNSTDDNAISSMPKSGNPNGQLKNPIYISTNKKVALGGFKIKRKVFCGLVIFFILLAVATGVVVYALTSTQQKIASPTFDTLTTPATEPTNFQLSPVSTLPTTPGQTSIHPAASPTTAASITTVVPSSTQQATQSIALQTTALELSTQNVVTTTSQTVLFSPTVTTKASSTLSTSTSTTDGCISTDTPLVETLIQNNAILALISGIVLDSNNTVYTYSITNKQIIQVDLNLNSLVPVVLASIPSTIQNPVGGSICYNDNNIYVPASGLIYMVDLQNNSYVSIFAGTGSNGNATDGYRLNATFILAKSCAFDKNGNMYVGDRNLIRIVSPDGLVSTWPHFQYTYSSAILIDSLGRLLVVDYYNHQIYRFNFTDLSYAVVAGNGNTTYVDGQGIDSQFGTGYALAEDKYGNIFYSDFAGNAINMLNTTGYFSRVAGDGQAGMISPTRFYHPLGIAFDNIGRLIVADSNNNAIRAITFQTSISCPGSPISPPIGISPQISIKSKIVVSTFMIDIANFAGSNGVAIDSSNNVYTISSYGRVFKITPDRSISILAIISNATFSDQGLCYGNNGLYIASRGTIFKIDLTTNLVSIFAGTGTSGSPVDGYNTTAVFRHAQSCAFDRSAVLFVADFDNIRKINSSGYVSTTYSGPCSGCVGVMFDATGRLIATDYKAAKLYNFNFTDSTYTTVVGTGNSTHADGQGTQASLSDPNTSTLDSHGNIFIPEYSGCSVSWLNSTNYLRQIAGGTCGYSNLGGGKFKSPSQTAMDSYERLYVSDRNGNSIRMITWYD